MDNIYKQFTNPDSFYRPAPFWIWNEEMDSNENNQNSKEIYTSIFNVYNSYEEFIEKNMIKLTDIKNELL